MRYKAKDIAKELGVSTATVSLVLNNKPGVGEQRRREILEKIQELDCEYMIKDSIVNKGSIGFVVYKRNGSIIAESPFFNFILEGINDSIRKYGYNLNFLYLNKDTPPAEQEYQLKSSGCRGFIIFAVEMQMDDVQMFIDSKLPFTMLDNSFQERDIDAVAINNAQGTSKAVEYLYQMGHREIGYIKSKVRINSFDERRSVFKRKMHRLGLESKPEYVVEVGYSETEMREDFKLYLAQNPKLPTAFFAENDLIGCNAVKSLQEMGHHVPEEVSVIGFDNRPITDVIEPGLTTINVPKNIFGPAAVDLLISRMEKKREQSLKIEVGTNLIVRQSVKKITE